jgi:hypothetical protein
MASPSLFLNCRKAGQRRRPGTALAPTNHDKGEAASWLNDMY